MFRLGLQSSIMFSLNKLPHRFLLLPKLKSDAGPGPVFHKYLTPVLGLKEKCRILPESTPELQIW